MLHHGLISSLASDGRMDTAARWLMIQPCQTPPSPSTTTAHAPVCRLEIGHFRRQPGAERIDFVDVSQPGVDPGPDLPRDKAMGRFHVRLPTGELRSGGAAFVEIWDALPLYRPAAWLARLPGVTPILDVGYEIASPLRPLAARFKKHIA